MQSTEHRSKQIGDRKPGPMPALRPEQEAELVSLYLGSDLSIAELLRRFSARATKRPIAKATLYNILRRHGVERRKEATT